MSVGIHHLPTSTQARLRSSQIITSLPQLVSELAQNSLDAGARRVEVGVDCDEWSCWVRDDGCGMSKSDLTALLNAGRYSTSKAYAPASLDEVTTFGFRGEALASIADLCCLEISSRTQRSRECWSVILKSGETLYNGPAIRWRLESSGTVVSVRDAFYNLPVRRRSHPSAQRSLELVRKELEAHALVFPQVSFTLENTSSASQGRSERGRVLAIPKTASTLQAFRHLFGRALVEQAEEINEAADPIAIDGFISLEGSPSRAYQYLYINRHLLAPCDLHRIIDTSFARSSFARNALNEYMELSQPLSATRRSPKKSDKKPVYVLNITVPPQQVDNCMEPAKATVQLQDSGVVAALLSSVITRFLVKHGFIADNAHQPKSSGSPPRKRKKLAVLHSVERGPTLADTHGASSSRAQNISTSQAQTPIVIPEENANLEGEFLWTDAKTGETFAVDRRTGNSYPVNKRRGDVAGVGGGRRTIALQPSVGKGLADVDRTGNGRLDIEREPTEAPQWIQEALGANDVFMLKSSQRAVPALALSSSFTQGVDEWHRQHGHARPGQGKARQGVQHLARPHAHVARFTKADLRGAAVLGQVDRKFVACVLSASALDEDAAVGEGRVDRGQTTLVLIDQHAADERVRVERILGELCAAFTPPGEVGQDAPAVLVRCLTPPVRVLLTRHEAEQLAMSSGVRRAFELWGVRFTDASLKSVENGCSSVKNAAGKRQKEDSGYAQVAVESVPGILAAKLLDGDTLRDLIKTYIAELAALGNPEAVSLGAAHANSADASAGATGWQRALRWCPRELLELANSRACRGAIMFNDVLATERCARLVRELADAALPFQCAHGRPSLVPLANLGAEVGTGKGIAYSRHLQPVDWARFAAAGYDSSDTKE